MANPILEQIYTGEFVLSEGPRTRSRDTVVIAQSQTLLAGTVLGYSSVGALAGTFSATGAHGNPTCGTITVAAGSLVGEFDIVMDDATHFHVLLPDDAAGATVGEGQALGDGVFGSAFSGGGLGFTLTAGGTACNPGDELKITVSQSAALNEYEAVNASATDGTQNAAAISFGPVTTGSGVTAKAVAIIRAAEVKAGMLQWPAGATTNQIAAWTAQLAAIGIISR
jgi:hypothetical protein